MNIECTDYLEKPNYKLYSLRITYNPISKFIFSNKDHTLELIYFYKRKGLPNIYAESYLDYNKYKKGELFVYSPAWKVQGYIKNRRYKKYSYKLYDFFEGYLEEQNINKTTKEFLEIYKEE